jgi:glycosyltransferase involved in cell wall biosynthesis
LRIAYIVTSLGIGGAERQVAALSERMHARGHAAIILVLTPSVPEQWTALVEVVHLNLRKTPLSVAKGFARAVRVLREFRPDILHCHNFHGNLFGRLLRVALPGVGVISTIHNIYEGGRLRMAAYWVSDSMTRCTVAVCKAAAEKMVRLGAVPRRKCIAIPNGINANEFSPDAKRRECTRRQMMAKDGFVWLATGRIVPAKNYENLLRAFAWVRQTKQNAELWIAGEGEGEYAERIHALGVELGMNGSIRWLGLRRDLARFLDAADGFVLSSAWEGMPLALGEAMAMEKPVVATDVGGVRELVGDRGTIVAAGNSAALAQGMLEVMHGTIVGRKEFGHAARRRIAEGFSVDANADSWEALYRFVLMKE